MAAMLAACAGQQFQVNPSLGNLPASRAAAHDVRTESWMLAEAKTEKLIYASDINRNEIFALSYATGKLVGTITSLSSPFGLCSDRSGDLFVTDASEIVEYAHAGTVPIATVHSDGADFTNCAVDSVTGNLAATMFEQNSVAIFKHARGSPTIVLTHNGQGGSCTYDAKGDLFVDEGNRYYGTSIEELPAKQSSFVTIASDINANFDTLQSYGGDLLLDVADIQQYRVSGQNATLVGVVKLAGGDSFRDLGGNQFVVKDGLVIAPFGFNPWRPTAFLLGFWKYPSGTFVKAFGGMGNGCLYGVAISPANR
jgi:hypothetical protein